MPDYEDLASELAAWANCGFQDDDYEEALNLMSRASKAITALLREANENN